MISLPAVGNRVLVRVEGWREPLASRVHEFDAASIVISPPSDGPTAYRLAVGREIVLEWATAHGLGRVPGQVVARIDHVPALVVAVRGPVEVAERRRDLRVAAELDFTARRSQGEEPPVWGRTIDVGAGGLLGCVALELTPDDTIELCVRLPDEEPVNATARVARHVASDVYGFSFSVITPRDRERLACLAAPPRTSAAERKAA